MRARVCGSNPKPPVFLSLWRRNLIEDGGDKPLDQKSPKGSRERERRDLGGDRYETEDGGFFEYKEGAGGGRRRATQKLKSSYFLNYPINSY